MAAPDANPYESPQTVTTEPPASPLAAFLRILGRVVTIASTGFASFFTIGLLFVMANEDASIIWARGIGVLGAVLFVSTELFNSAQGQKAGFLARFVASIAVFFLSVIINAFVGPGPQLRSQETDPYWIQRNIIFAAVLVLTFSVARLVWLRNQSAPNSDTQRS